jgi:tripartite-type tricarboxylate transporter receptor subunit TctC
MTSRLTGHSKLGRRATLSGGLGAACALAAPVLGIPGTGRAQGAPWPTRPVTLVVGFPPGGQTDFAARVVQPGLSAALGQTVVIDNRGGANGNLATEAVLRARADGYTLLMGREATQAINPHVLPGVTIDPLRLTPIGVALQSSMVLCVHPSVPARNVQDLVAWVKSQPGRVDYGSPSVGSLSHLTMELFRNRIGNPLMEHVSYRGSGPAMQDFIAGRFSLMFDVASVVAPFLRANQVRGLFVASDHRIPAFSDIPTAAEQGLQDFIIVAWAGLFGPPGLPPEIVQKAHGALTQVLQDAATRERITGQGDEPGGNMTPEQLGGLMRSDHARWGEVVRANNIRSE